MTGGDGGVMFKVQLTAHFKVELQATPEPPVGNFYTQLLRYTYDVFDFEEILSSWSRVSIHLSLILFMD
jgi:hypothetical protein